MITAAEFIRIFQHYFPEPVWEVSIGRAGLLGQFQGLSVRTIEPINDQIYGQAFQITGSRPTKYEWRWEAGWKDPLDDDYDVDLPPDGDGIPGEEVTLTVSRDVTWVWKEIPVEFEQFNLLEEISPEDADKMAKKMVDDLRAYGITW